MCPDPQLLSVYYDGELPHPWKGKMESHLEQCPRCRQKLENFSLLSRCNRKIMAQAGALTAGPQAAGLQAAGTEGSALERVWKKIAEETGIGALITEDNQAKNTDHNYQVMRYSDPNIWRRKVILPLPAAAAAAAVILIVAVAALWSFQIRNQQARQNMTVASEEYSVWPSAVETNYNPGAAPAANLNEVLQYLGSKDSGDTVILRLPDTKSFFRSGTPAMIKAADYSRRKP